MKQSPWVEIMKTRVLLIIIYTFGTFLCPKCFGKIAGAPSNKTTRHDCTNETITEKEVVEHIFANHTAWCRPLRNARGAIDVNVRLVLSAINDVVERDRIVKLTGYLVVTWNDELHVWNNTWPYSCLNSLIIPESELWLPEIATINSETHYDLMISKNAERIKLFSNGTSVYRPGGTFNIFCNFDITYFPFDEQTCLLQLESWRYTHPFQHLLIAKPAVSYQYWIENEQWLLVGTNSRALNLVYVTVENVFDHIEFEFTIRRKVGYYMMNVIIPSIIISVAQMAVFTLPVDEVMKIHISFTCLLAYGVFQLMIIEDMPRSSDNIPLLSYYIDLSMGYIAASMLCEGAVFICLRNADDKDVKRVIPPWLYRTVSVLSFFIRVEKPLMSAEDLANSSSTGLSNVYRETPLHEFKSIWERPHVGSQISTTHRKGVKEEPKKSAPTARINGDDDGRHNQRTVNQAKWQFAADVIDRFTMLLYLFLIIATPVSMFVLVPDLSQQHKKQ